MMEGRSEQTRKSGNYTIEDFLAKLDVDLLQYVPDFRRFGFTSANALKFLKHSDLEGFSTKVPFGHKRMILNAAEKLKTPSSKLGLSPDTPRPAVTTVDECSFDGEGRRPGKKLFGESAQDKWKILYQTPLEKEIEEINEDLSVKTAELQSAREYVDLLNTRYSDERVDKTRAQCSICHLRTGHTKRSCPNGPCQSAQQCSDIEKHPEEKRVLSEAAETKRNIQKELERLESTLAMKEKLKEQVTSTFSSKITPYLVNSDPDTYTFQNDSGSGRLLKSQKVLQDCWILEGYYKGKVPKDLELESKLWKNIINSHNEKFRKMSKKEVRERDPIKKRLEDNERYPVVFPKYNRASGCEDQLTTPQTQGCIPQNTVQCMMYPASPTPAFQGNLQACNYPMWPYQMPSQQYSSLYSGLNVSHGSIPTPAGTTCTMSYADVYGVPTEPPVPTEDKTYNG